MKTKLRSISIHNDTGDILIRSIHWSEFTHVIYLLLLSVLIVFPAPVTQALPARNAAVTSVGEP